MDCDVSPRSISPEIFYNNFLGDDDIYYDENNVNNDKNSYNEQKIEVLGCPADSDKDTDRLDVSSLEENEQVFVEGIDGLTLNTVRVVEVRNSDSAHDVDTDQENNLNRNVGYENGNDKHKYNCSNEEDKDDNLLENSFESNCSFDSPVSHVHVAAADIHLKHCPNEHEGEETSGILNEAGEPQTDFISNCCSSPIAVIESSVCNENSNQEDKLEGHVEVAKNSRNDSEERNDCVRERSHVINECTCEQHGVKVSLNTEEARKNETEKEQSVDSTFNNKTNHLSVQEFMVGLVAGNTEDELGNGSVSKRKMDRLATRLPRIYHTREPKGRGKTRLKSQRLSYKGSKTPMTLLSEFAKENQYDLSFVMENAEQLGLDAQFPCMQCFDRHGRSALLGSMMKSMYSNRRKQPGNNKCASCGAEKMNLATFGKMILQLKKTFNEMGLVVRDVSSDGNCLFAAIVDQMRVRGDFRYTQENLRLAAVEYLKNNPTSDDGTPYALFLSGETWDQYLCKMSKDGEWGDHIVLSAIANVVKKTVVIFGGRTGEGLTRIVPKGSLLADLYTTGTTGTTHEHNLNTANCDCVKETMLDRENGEDNNTGEEKKPPKYDDSCLYLGHIGESHYVSLRRKDWRSKLEQDVCSNLEAETSRCDQLNTQPEQHLNVMVKQILQSKYIKSTNETVFDMIENTLKTDQMVSSLVGDQVNKLCPYVVSVKRILPTGSEVFSDNSDNTADENESELQLNRRIFITTLDTEVVDDFHKGKKFDLVLESVCGVHNLVRLCPVKPSVWKGRTVTNDNATVYLKSFPLRYFAKGPSVTRDFVLAFRCQWPSQANEWSTRKPASGWPDARTVENVVSEGVHVVPTDLLEATDILDECDYVKLIQGDKSLWLISFASAEKEIARFIPESARNCFLLFKTLVDSFLKNQGGLPASCLKHIFFYACEDIQTQKWKKEPSYCLMHLLNRLAMSLKTKLPHYFSPQKNLLQAISKENVDKCLRHIELLLSQPLLGMFLLMDEHELDITELGPLMDDIIEDVFRFNRHRVVSRSVEEGFIPGLYCLFQDYILQDDFENAMKVAQEISVLLGMPDSDDCLISIITRVLRTQYIGYGWCLTLYIELMTGRKCLTRKLCEGYKTVPITDVFGPEIGDELKDIVVPEVFSITTGDLIFPTKAATVLDLSGNTKLMTKCLRYFIETYHDTFGERPPQPCHICGSSSCCPCTLLKVKQLQTLYAYLFVGYTNMGCPTEIRDLLPRLSRLTEMTGTASSYHSLASMYAAVGDRQRAAEYRKKKMNTLNAYSYDDDFDLY